ncbi:hypothetical protein BDQ17DRAFT_1435046 [Cyathus striatus]|nr:hypothetical protein BDQ17DRAFT_1435046 [Cyathus striatus]
MSDSDSFQYRKTILHITLLESFMNGIYFCVVAATLYIMVSKKYIRTQKVLATIIVIMYALATTHLAIRWQTIFLGFVQNGQTEDTIFNFLNSVPFGLQVPGSIALVANTIIADCILIWRCWKVWGNDWRAPVLPTLTAIAETFFSVLSIIEQAQPSTLSRIGVDPSLVYLSLSLVTTMLATFLIIFRVVYLSWQSGDIHRYQTIVEIIVESAALYSLTLLVYIPLLPSTDFSDGYPQVILVSMTGIAPTLISARVCLGWSRPDAKWKRNRSDTGKHSLDIEQISLKSFDMEKSIQAD